MPSGYGTWALIWICSISRSCTSLVWQFAPRCATRCNLFVQSPQGLLVSQAAQHWGMTPSQFLNRPLGEVDLDLVMFLWQDYYETVLRQEAMDRAERDRERASWHRQGKQKLTGREILTHLNQEERATERSKG